MLFTLANSKQASVRTFGKDNSLTFVASQAMANQLFTAISGHWVTRLGQYMHNDTQFFALTIRDMGDVTNPEFQSNLAAVSGSSANAALPQDVALVLTAEPNLRGRGAKGRLFFPGWATNAAAAPGQAIDAARVALNAFGADLMLELNAVALGAAIAKPARNAYIGLTNAQHPQRPASVVELNAYTCQDTEFDTQRRRGL